MTSAFPWRPKEAAARDHPCPPARARWGHPGRPNAGMGVMEGVGMLEGLRVMEGTEVLEGFLSSAAEKRARGGGRGEDRLHKSRQTPLPGNVSPAT